MTMKLKNEESNSRFQVFLSGSRKEHELFISGFVRIVSLHVSSEHVEVAEAPPTLAAVVWPLLRVVLHVVFERRAEQEALAADAAFERLLSGVRPQVCLHV